MHLKFTNTVKTPVAAIINFTYLCLLYNMALGPEWVLQILIVSIPKNVNKSTSRELENIFK